jgi:hypothetical protein
MPNRCLTMFVRIRLLCLYFILGASCKGARPPTPAHTLIQTQAKSYRAVISSSSVEVTVVATFTNSTSDKLTLHPCAQAPPYPLDVSLQRYQPGKWTTVFSPVCTLLLMMDPPRLLPGQTRTDTVRLFGYRNVNAFPQFPEGPLTGLYRLAYAHIYRTWNADTAGPRLRGQLGERLSDSLLVSNPFRIEE